VSTSNRILAVLPADAPLPFALPPNAEIVHAPDIAAAQELLKTQGFAGVWLGPAATAELTTSACQSAERTKLDTLYKAGLELAALEPDQLARMSTADRINCLKANILRQIKTLLGYDRLDIRLLQPSTGLLEPLACEGMDEGTEKLQLYAKPTGFGTSGHVAATGQSYYCPDTANDSLYIQGAASTQSSLTVPLLHHDEVVGVMTIDSPHRDGFTPADRQMLELFGREIGAALHTLRMLSAEREGVAQESVEVISREVAMPIDAILNAAASLLDRYIGLDPEMTEKLQQIRAQARAVRECIQRAGEALAPPRETRTQPKDLPLFGIRVLVADADDLTLRSAHKILAKLGCAVETAHTAGDAVAMARLTRYDFALVDLRLPDSIGYDTFAALRNADPRLRIVLMSGYGYDPTHSIVRAKQEGLAGALYKPFRVDQLLDVLLAGPAKPSPAAPAHHGTEVSPPLPTSPAESAFAPT
jgi:ActR/RegA family two-component response regulator/GAF domain-containing protein